ncbi:MAG: hypothetical protein Fur0021_20600 [Candidatus Promineifilaceae bacterium]
MAVGEEGTPGKAGVSGNKKATGGERACGLDNRTYVLVTQQARGQTAGSPPRNRPLMSCE